MGNNSTPKKKYWMEQSWWPLYIIKSPQQEACL